MDLLIVGSGFFGLTIAERAASAGRKVTVIDRRRHIGGNAYSEDEPETGIEVHRYGAHLFHTSNPTVWEYVNRFTTFTDYVHRVYTNHKGVVFRCPSISARSTSSSRRRTRPMRHGLLIHELAGEFDAKEAANLEEKGDRADRPAPLRGVHPRLHREAVADRSEGSPCRGHQPAAGALQLRQPVLQRHVGGPSHGRLHRLDRADGRSSEHRGPARYRLLRRGAAAQQGRDGRPASDRLHRPDRSLLRRCRGCSVVAHARLRAGGAGGRRLPGDAGHELRGCGHSVHAYPRVQALPPRAHRPVPSGPHGHHARVLALRDIASDEPYYPVNTAEDRAGLLAYRELAKGEKDVHFGGRLGTYQYLDMHMAIGSALSMWNNRLASRARDCRP